MLQNLSNNIFLKGSDAALPTVLLLLLLPVYICMCMLYEDMRNKTSHDKFKVHEGYFLIVK